MTCGCYRNKKGQRVTFICYYKLKWTENRVKRHLYLPSSLANSFVVLTKSVVQGLVLFTQLVTQLNVRR
jgi:hypothetical protein